MKSWKEELERHVNNLIGTLFGYEKCVFCGDRSNWKDWVDTIDISEHQIKYELPMCAECFGDKTLVDLLSSVIKNIAEYNRLCRSFGASTYYTDADKTLILNAVEDLKKKFRV